MKLSIGIVGLPNVGKSTLFNALLKKSPFVPMLIGTTEGQAGRAKIANYPFTTIEPNVGVVEVPDERLPVLAKIVNTQKIVPAIVEFYDIAGLVRGASQGEGLGNKFLAHIREVAAIVHVVRLFQDQNIVHVSDTIEPENDIQTIETELILADLETLKKQREPRQNAEKEEKLIYEIVQLLKTKLDQGIPARNVSLSDEQKILVTKLNLLTMKPVIYVFNVSETQLEKHEETENKIQNILKFLPRAQLGDSSYKEEKNSYIYLCAKLENDVLTFSEDEQKEFLLQYHLPETGLNRLIKKAYETLNLISFLTAGEKSSSAKASEGQGEVRAWTITKGTFAPQAAGVIHTDFEKHFIKADIVPYPLFVTANGWVKAREQGKVQTVGRDYLMKDGDVVEFKVGV